jgi:hypothetical protein
MIVNNNAHTDLPILGIIVIGMRYTPRISFFLILILILILIALSQIVIHLGPPI